MGMKTTLKELATAKIQNEANHILKQALEEK
jgi:hypothetical protein